MANNVKVWLYSSDPSVYNDATAYAVSVSITTGKSRTLDHYEPGSVSITFNNYNRVFDPTNVSSPFYGYIKPKQRVYVSVSGYALFSGLVDDWSFNYDVNGEAFAYLTATDKTSLFANQYLPAQTFPAELSGARVSRILNDDAVAWPTSYGSQVISTGTQMLDADTISANTNVLDYLRQIETSEQGQLYISGTDSLKFKDNNYSVSDLASLPVFADDGTGWGYDSIDVSYSSQLLYNRIEVNTWDALTSITANSSDSQTSYGIYKLTIDGVLYTDTDKLKNLCSLISSKYSQPEYRFNSVRLNYYALSNSDQDLVSSTLILNSFASVKYTPNGTGSVIQKYVRIIGVNHDISPGSHFVTYQLESIKNPSLVLDDSEFGKLDYYSLGL